MSVNPSRCGGYGPVFPEKTGGKERASEEDDGQTKPSWVYFQADRDRVKKKRSHPSWKKRGEGGGGGGGEGSLKRDYSFSHLIKHNS